MDNDFKFTWSRMSLGFPENKEDLNKVGMEFDHYYPEFPEFSKEQISFAYKKDYGVQMHLNQTIPDWIEANKKELEYLTKMHSDLSHRLYENTLKELDASFEIFERWRNLIHKNNGRGWEGNLQNNLHFENKGNLVTLGDYYKFYINSDFKDNCPTDLLHKIGKLPEDSLNEKWKNYHRLAKNISKGFYKNTSNLFIGKDITECIKNADEIYKIADELKELKF